MNKKDRVKLEILSNIDENIIEEVTQKRIKLSRNLQKVGFWRRKWVPITAIAAALAMVGGIFLAILLLGKQVPVYTGMTVSNQSPFEVAYAGDAQYEQLAATGHFEGDHIHEPPKPPKKPALESVVEDSLQVEGAAQTLYYAKPNEDIYITVHIDNPDQYEILSFTLNGKKYSSYMFEEGSDMENLVLKVNVGDVEGLVEYTIDAIKYVDGTQIKDVKMEGDQTVRVGVKPQKEVSIKVENETVDYDSISFAVSVADQHKLIEGSAGKLQAALYLENELVATKDLSLTEPTEVVFDSLHPNTAYQYAIVAHYDPLDGKGFGTHILYQNEVYTQAGLLFGDINITQTELSFALTWHERMAQKALTSLVLYRGEEKVRELSLDASKLSDLLSGVEYTLVAEYVLNGITEQIKLTFTTATKTIPEVEIINPTKTQTSLGFEISETDADNIGAITKIELLKDGQLIKTAEILDIRSFDALLSNNTYTVKVTYVYDLNDGKGSQTGETTLDITTEAKATPVVEITNPTKTQTSLGFEITESDPDNIGAITKIELLKDGQLIKTAESLDVRSFEGLLSDNTYTVKVTCVYDLNDGKGSQTGEATLDIKTIAKARPVVTFENLKRNCNLKTMQTSVQVDVKLVDVDQVATVQSVSVYQGDSLIANSNNLTTALFENLDATVEYTLKVVYAYDLNDGNGVYTDTVTMSTWETSKGLEIQNGRITGIGSCTDTVLYCNLPIAYSAFNGINTIYGVFLGEGVTSIGVFTFDGCKSLTSIIIPDSVTSIGKHAFYNCSALTSVTMGNNVTSIDDSVFNGCKKLTSITIPNGVTSIGSSAFKGCRSLTSITIPDSVTSIGEYAFSKCSALTSIAIPEGVTSIGEYAFEGCTSITSIAIPEGVTSIGESAFKGCTSLTSITIPDSVSSIGLSAFSNCSALTSVTIGNNLTSIDTTVFFACTSLTSITIPDSVTSIGDSAFQGCTSLTSIVIPNSVTYIDEWTFADCKGLKNIIYGGTAEEWNKIVIEKNNDSLTAATVYYYSETEPTDASGNYWHYVNGEPTLW